MKFTTTAEYNNHLVETLTRIALKDYIIHNHEMFHSDQNIDFMEEFMQLCEQSEKFVVSQEMLRKYGVLNNIETSGTIKRILEQNNLEKDKDYQLYNVVQPLKGTSGGATSGKNVYTLTPNAFKLCLIRSKNSKTYAKYYLFIEQVVHYYSKYQHNYDTKILEQKDCKINKLIEQNNELLERTKHIEKQNDKLNATVDDNQLEISKLHNKIDVIFESMLSFARMTIPTWVGSSVIKQQFDTLANNKDTSYALKHLKVMFMVGFFVHKNSTTETKMIGTEQVSFRARGAMKVYACCTNFADIGARIRKLYNKYTESDTDEEKTIMFMLKPTVISLISCEINTERIILENSNIFPKKSLVEWDSLHKCFNISIGTKYYTNAQKIFDGICTKASNERFQGYQMRIDEYNKSTDVKVDSKILNYINNIDNQFFSSTKPYCQKFVDSYVSQSFDEDNNLVEWEYTIPDRKSVKRVDLNNANLSTAGYTLRKIELLIDEHNATDHIEHMVVTKIISKEDVPALKAFAEFDNIDLSDIDIPDDLD